jgi:hypothetical protein
MVKNKVCIRNQKKRKRKSIQKEKMVKRNMRKKKMSIQKTRKKTKKERSTRKMIIVMKSRKLMKCLPMNPLRIRIRHQRASPIQSQMM